MINIFDTRTMLKAMEQMKPPRTFLRDTFFPSVRTFDTKKVDIDLRKGKRKMAPFVSPRVGGKTVERQGYRTDTYEPCLVAPDMITTADDLFKRLPGENLYGGKSPEERAAEQLGIDLVELDDMITRREEWMCAQALLSGVINMVGEGINETINFGLTNEILAAERRWTAEGSDPLADLKIWRRERIKASGITPNIAVMASDVIDIFINHPKVKGALDNRRIDLGKIDPMVLPNGVTYYGYIKDVGLDIYAYDEWYLDDDGVEKPMVPEGKVLIGSTNARTERLYGAVALVDQDKVYSAERVPRSWTQKKPSARFVQVMSRPLPVQVDAFFFAMVK